MDSYVLVNIFNEGFINWIGEVGPVFGYSLPIGILDLIRMDPMIRIEITTPDKAREAKIKYYKEKEEKARAMMGLRKQQQKETTIVETTKTAPTASGAQDSIQATEKLTIKTTVKEETPVVEETKEEEVPVIETVDVKDTVEEDDFDIDNQIDEIIETTPYRSILDNKTVVKKEAEEVLENETVVEKPVKKYSTKELNTKTKQELKNILLERGYTSGMWAPKYHDKLSDLIKKIQKTQ